jgi:VWFA-related protein
MPARHSLQAGGRRIAAFFFLLAAATGAAPATGQFTSTVNVDLITVEVVVTDRAGGFVRGLRPVDFRVLEDGKEQAISHFQEVGAAVTGDGAVAPTAVGRELLVFLDLYHSYFEGPTVAARVIGRLRAELPELAATGTRIAVASYDGTLTVHMAPTVDSGSIGQALDQAAETVVRPVEPEAGTARQGASQLEERVGWMEDALEAAMRAMPRSGARRVVLAVTPGRNAYSEMAAKGPSCTSLDCLSQKASWLATYGSMEKMGLLARTSHVATELGFTLFTLDPSDLSLTRESKERRWSLREAATATGGTARVHGDVTGAIADVAARTTAYYALAYPAELPGDGLFHEIRVEVPSRPELTLTFRKRYVDRPDEDRRTAALLSELLAGTGGEPLGAAITAGAASRRTGLIGGIVRLAVVPIKIRIPLSHVTLLPEGETARGSVFLVAYATERWAQRSAVHKQAIPIEVPVADLARARTGFWNYTFDLQVEASSPSLHIGVADATSGASSTAQLPLAQPGE